MLHSLLIFHFIHLSTQSESSCDSKIFCQGKLLHTVQTKHVFSDSKTFVDLKMRHDENTILQNFDNLLKNTREKPTRKQIKNFLGENFEKYDEFDRWTPPDFTHKPEFLQRICDEEIRDFAQELVNIWPNLSRKIKREVMDSPHLFTLLPVDNGFMVPGGRFREFYYWDSYWIIEGLLLSEMTETVRGILDNFISMVKRYGLVPNGSRIYYTSRSQPPLLTLMVSTYLEATNDTKWLSQNIGFLEQELDFFLKNRITEVEKSGMKYLLAHYVSHDGTPRPESYSEDIKTASSLRTNEEKRSAYKEIRSGAESGWDFSSRWIFDQHGGTNANLTYIKTSRVIPVDLNAFLCQAFRIMSRFYVILENYDRANFWLEKSEIWLKTIAEVFYHKEDGIWYDWDNHLGKPRRMFYPSNLVPLWAEAYNLADSEEVGRKAAEYLVNSGVLEFDGGVPTSLTESGEQWDYPNGWPPLQSMVIFGLDQTGCAEAQKIAKDLANKWLESNLMSFYENGKMFEKYDVQNSGESGKGGEYGVQDGFGWTNGVLFQLINRYYTHPKKKS